MKFVIRILKYLSELRLKFCFQHSIVRVKGNAKCFIAEDCRIRNCRIWVGDNCHLIIKKNALLKNISLYIEEGTVTVDENVLLIGESREKRSQYIINKGQMMIDHHTKLMCKRIWIRFGGIVNIGCYTNINSGTEIRADESVNIGNYCRISYNVKIWDTNTHCIYPAAKRRELNRLHWPHYGFEFERSKTAEVRISNDCWIGEEASILKGSILGAEVIVGYRTVIAGKEVPSQHTVVQDITYKIIKR